MKNTKSSKQLNSFSPSLATARLKVIKGPHKGVVYKLVAGKVTIGRSSENDIALANDEKCSRKQAVINLGPNNSYSVKDLTKRASVKVNNLTKIHSDLQDGDLIQFGSTVLQFEHKVSEDLASSGASKSALPSPLPSNQAVSTGQNLPSPAPQPTGRTPTGHTPTPYSQPHQTGSLSTQNQSSKNLLNLKADSDLPADQKVNQAFPPPPPYPPNVPPIFSAPLSQKQKRPRRFKIILIALALLGVFLYFSDENSNKKEQEDKLRTIMEREKDVKTLTELKEKEQEKRKKNKLSSYKNAQFAYINGIRDYRKGVYSRAIESFRVCKTLYPQHELCSSYLQKAQIKNQQLIQAWMVAGKDYREKRRFVPCMSSFKNVMMAIRDNQNITYKEALENYKICQIQHKDRY